MKLLFCFVFCFCFIYMVRICALIISYYKCHRHLILKCLVLSQL